MLERIHFYEETQVDKSAVVPGRFNFSSQFLFGFTGGNRRHGGRSPRFGAGYTDEQRTPGESASSLIWLVIRSENAFQAVHAL